MSAALEEKKKLVEELKEKIGAAKSIVIVDYKGLTVFEDTELRKTLREANVEYRVLKNRLMQKAFSELGYNDFDEALNGPTAVAFANARARAPDALSYAAAQTTFSVLAAKRNESHSSTGGLILNPSARNSLPSPW